MSQAFPLIRAGSLGPFLRWMRANAIPVEGQLRAADLPASLGDDPDQPVALASAFALGRLLSRRVGGDLGCRVATRASLADLGAIGSMMLSARTPREALRRLSAASDYYCSHEIFSLTPAVGGVIFRDRVMLDMDVETQHIQDQHTAALVRALCTATGHRGEPFGRVELMPHLAAGLDHLHRWLGPNLVPSRDRTLSIFIPAEVVDRPFPRPPRDRARLPDARAGIRGDGRYASTAQIVVEMMLEDGEPSVQRLAAASGSSLRTVQRRLEAEGTSFTRLLDDARRRRAIQALAAGSEPIGEIGAQLGYSGQPAFTRAVRRWTHASPSSLRIEGPTKQPVGPDTEYEDR